jgi:hypothetical protein
MSRRDLLRDSLVATAGVLAVGNSIPAIAEEANSPDPIMDLNPTKLGGGERIVQITVVVKDAQQAAERLSRVFGASWKFYEFTPQNLRFHGRTQGAPCVLKVAIGYFAGYSFKLIQPISGRSPYGEFLETHGSGYYSLGLGNMQIDGAVVDRFAKAGVGTELEGDIGNGARFAVLDTVNLLGCRFEFATWPQSTGHGYFRQTGAFVPSRRPILDMDNPAVIGGRRFDEIGIIVKDPKQTARNYQALFGIDEWGYSEGGFHPSTELLFGKSVPPGDLAAADLSGAYTYTGGAMLELLSPKMWKGTHGLFLQRHGQGIQMLRMNSGGDFDSEIAALTRAGLTVERDARFDISKDTSGPYLRGIFLNMGEDMSGFVFEFFYAKQK